MTFDASIPVLTEVLGDNVAPAEPAPAAAPEIHAVPASAAAHAAPHAAPAAAAESSGLPSDDEGWEQLERRVAERVLQQLTSRVDFVLEQRIKDSMAEVLNHALHSLTTEIRHGLHDTIGKIVTRAVQQEITHLQASASRRREH